MGPSNIRDFPLGDPATPSSSPSRTEARLARLEACMECTATKADIESLKTLIVEKQNSMIRWLAGALTTTIVAVTIAMIQSFFD